MEERSGLKTKILQVITIIVLTIQIIVAQSVSVPISISVVSTVSVITQNNVGINVKVAHVEHHAKV